MESIDGVVELERKQKEGRVDKGLMQLYIYISTPHLVTEEFVAYLNEPTRDRPRWNPVPVSG
jgi:hypothetical protein